MISFLLLFLISDHLAVSAGIIKLLICEAHHLCKQKLLQKCGEMSVLTILFSFLWKREGCEFQVEAKSFRRKLVLRKLIFFFFSMKIIREESGKWIN